MQDLAQDRSGGSLVPLTQEFLAYMMGVRREGVTAAAGALSPTTSGPQADGPRADGPSDGHR